MNITSLRVALGYRVANPNEDKTLSSLVTPPLHIRFLATCHEPVAALRVGDREMSKTGPASASRVPLPGGRWRVKEKLAAVGAQASPGPAVRKARVADSEARGEQEPCTDLGKGFQVGGQLCKGPVAEPS